MCSPAAYISTGLQVASVYMGQRETAAAAQTQMEAQRTAAIKEMNYRFQNFEQERIDAFDSAVNELDKIHRQAMEINSNVNVAVDEGMSNGGNTAHLIKRQLQGDVARATLSTKDNYERKSNEVDLNKESALLSTQDFIKNLNDSAPRMPSAFDNFLTTAGIGVKGYTQGQNQRQSEINAGKYDGVGRSSGGVTRSWQAGSGFEYTPLALPDLSANNYTYRAGGGLRRGKWY